jgi:hypothetical protein
VDLFQQEQTAKHGLSQALDELTAITPETLARTSELGTALDFSGGVGVFTRTLKLFEDLKEANLDTVPINTINTLKQSVTEAQTQFQQIREFDPGAQNNPGQIRDSLIQQVAQQYQTHFERLAPVISYSVRKGTDFEALEADARRTLEEVKRLQGEVGKTGQSVVAEANATLEQVKRAAAEVGVAQHATHFKNEADKHYKASWFWLVATALLGLLTIIYAAYNVWFYTTGAIELAISRGIEAGVAKQVVDFPTGQAIQIAIAKLVVFGVLYFSVIWSGRVYRSQMHNYVINRHRQNALSTFETFAKAASDEQTKNAVLIQATQSIFAPQASGFAVQEGEPSISPRVLEIIRGSTEGPPK